MRLRVSLPPATVHTWFRLKSSCTVSDPASPAERSADEHEAQAEDEHGATMADASIEEQAWFLRS
jgi:hypothetical protein